MAKHRAEENMTSAHSAKETEKWQFTEDETSAKNCQSFATIENEHTLDPKSDHIAKGQGMKDHGSLRSKPRRKTQSRVHHNCETLPKVQYTQLIMRASTKLRHGRERRPNTASTHNGYPIAKVPN